jgi:hypothetical protein
MVVVTWSLPFAHVARNGVIIVLTTLQLLLLLQKKGESEVK